MPFFHYIAIFRCRNMTPPLPKVVVKPVTVELLSGPLEYEIPTQISRVHVIDEGEMLAETGTLHVPEGSNYLVIRSQTQEPDWEELNRLIDEVIMVMSLVYQPQFFMEQIYRGTLAGGPKMILGMSVRPAKKECIEPDGIKTSIEGARLTLFKDENLKKRFALMARFYARALDYDPGEEKFLMMWTILEIYPMQGTSNIKPLKEMIATLMGKNEDEVNNTIGIGRLCGKRNDLVHNGCLDPADYNDVFRKLEMLVHEVMRNMLDLPYSGMLDYFWQDDKKAFIEAQLQGGQ